VRGRGQGECRGAAGEEKWEGCRARMAWSRAGAWACTMCQAGRLEEGRRTRSNGGMQRRPLGASVNLKLEAWSAQGQDGNAAV